MRQVDESMKTSTFMSGVVPQGNCTQRSRLNLLGGVRWIYVLVILIGSFLRGACGNIIPKNRDSIFIVDRFENEEPQHFTHLVVNKNTGTVYAGGTNRLYQLDSNLKVLQSVTTGPIADSFECPPSGCRGDRIRTMKSMDNINKVLVIDYTGSNLIVCGTIRQGSCQVRDLRDITILNRNVSELIAANTATASTVAFVAPGPPNPPVSHVLYMGVTYTNNSYYRSEVPAVASRSLNDENLLDIAITKMTTASRMYINSLSRERYPITYVYGFSSEKFSYFLTRQMDDSISDSPYTSKLVRVCQNDEDYYSYAEIPLECIDSHGKKYNLVQAAYVGKPGNDLATQLDIQNTEDVLFAVFSPSDPNESKGSPHPGSESALCVYSMKSIRQMFTKNIQECFHGKGTTGLNFISPSYPCIEIRSFSKLEEDFCGMDVNTPLGGKQPVEGLALLTFPTRLTAVTATSTEASTVVFLGTAQGHLKKVAIENQDNTWEYDDIVIDEESAVRQDMQFDNTGDHLYVMTDSKILKVKTSDCSVYEGCHQCLETRDPYCGWCVQENKCSLQQNCSVTTQEQQQWVTKTGCPTITQVRPDKLQRTVARTISLTIDNLPPVEGSLQCVFSAMDINLSTDAIPSAQGVDCVSPRSDLLPRIPKDEHHFTAKLSVRVSEGPQLASTNLTIYDCYSYVRCSDCVASPFPCAWCIDGNICTPDSAEDCRNDILVNGVNQVGPRIRSGPSFCPRITRANGPEILVPSGTEKSLKFQVENIALFIIQTRFQCFFNIDGSITRLNAALLANIIYCDQMDFVSPYGSPSTEVPVAVVWGNSKILDNPTNIHVQLYQCHLLADNCGMCQMLPEKYQCGWCQSTGRCEVKKQCRKRDWLERDSTCPDVYITNFHPKTGPLEGGTNITIEGINLGRSLEDISEGITVAGIPCQPHGDSYIPTKQITCMIDSPDVHEFKEGPITIEVAGEYRGESLQKYQFVNPEIKDLKPLSGPKSGGTVLHIIGNYMNAGKRIVALIGDSPCKILSTNATVATCISPYSSKLQNGKIEMIFDNGQRILEDKHFTYVEDPTVQTVHFSKSIESQFYIGPRGIPKGGIINTVTGTNLDIIKDPKLYVVYNDKEYTSPCEVKSSTSMDCVSPEINITAGLIDEVKGMTLDYGLIMDHVEAVRNLNKKGFPDFTVYPDPIYFPFRYDDHIKLVRSDYLILNGKNLDKASQHRDVKVHVGEAYCNVTSFSRSQISCRLPIEQPASIDDHPLPQVVVTVGNNLEYTIGRLKYAEDFSGVSADMYY